MGCLSGRIKQGRRAQRHQARLRRLGCPRELDAASTGTGGGSLNNYDTPAGKWYLTWIDPSGARVEFEGGLVDGEMVLTGTHKSGPQRRQGLLVRMTLRRSPAVGCASLASSPAMAGDLAGAIRLHLQACHSERRAMATVLITGANRSIGA